jgi:uncharacterized metal-binding protein YceD (DUF177 family)
MTQPAHTKPAQPWHATVRLEDVPDTGLHLDLVADEQVRTSLATLAGVVDMPRLVAVFDVVRHGNGLRATGRVTATVEQTCVVTLEPVENEVDEPIDVIFAPGDVAEPAADVDEDALDDGDLGAEPPEDLADGAADVGAIAAEFLLLGIDPYPRKPGTTFTPPEQNGAVISPFEALAKLKNGRSG